MSDYTFELGEIKPIGLVCTQDTALAITDAVVDVVRCIDNITVITGAAVTMTQDNPKQVTLAYLLDTTTFVAGSYLVRFTFTKDAVETRIICKELTVTQTEC